jgi:hypothetical protein
MPSWEIKIITAEAKRLLEQSRNDAELRDDLRALALQILAETGGAPSSDRAETKEAPREFARSSAADHSPPEGSIAEPLRPLTLGQFATVQTHVLPSPVNSHRPDDPIAEIETRSRRKAEAARWSAERQRRIREGTGYDLDNAALDPEIRAWADQLTDCFYWTSSAATSQSVEISLLDDVGGCFEAMAEALSLVHRILEHHHGHAKDLERALPLVAEAQSALRSATQAIHGPDDPDQLDVFEWLKATAAKHHIYIKRFMRADDRAEPTAWPGLMSRIDDLSARLRGVGREKPLHAAFESLRTLLAAIDDTDDLEFAWRRLASSVEVMVDQGLPPSDRELRDLLIPKLDGLPDRDDWPRGFQRVLREIDRYLASRSSAPEAPVPNEPTAEVRQAAHLLERKCALLIGGSRHREAQQSLIKALRLSELIWIETKEHQSIESFEPTIARQDVAVVLLAIRWSSHAFGEIKRFCDRYDKPLVRLPGGYNPNQVAAQIVSQCSGQLEAPS